jgi:hypothetical protein
VVLPSSAITDVASADRMITRNVVRCLPSGRCRAMIHVSAGYPPADGDVVPAQASAPAITGPWTYHGKFGGEVGSEIAQHRIWASSMAFRVDETGPASVNHGDPFGSRFVAIVDGFHPGLALIYSADGSNWFFARDTGGRVRNLLPPVAAAHGFSGIFASLDVDVDGLWHLVITDAWPPTKQGHLISRDGLDWQQASDPSRSIHANDDKCTTLYYDPRTRQICALFNDQDGQRASTCLLKATPWP